MIADIRIRYRWIGNDLSDQTPLIGCFGYGAMHGSFGFGGQQIGDCLVQVRGTWYHVCVAHTYLNIYTPHLDLPHQCTLPSSDLMCMAAI